MKVPDEAAHAGIHFLLCWLTFPLGEEQVNVQNKLLAFHTWHK